LARTEHPISIDLPVDFSTKFFDVDWRSVNNDAVILANKTGTKVPT
jgi:hypothetical protein